MRRLRAWAPAALAIVAASGIAEAVPVTFANYAQVGSADSIRFTDVDPGLNGTLTSIGAPIVNFQFLLGGFPPAVQASEAVMSVSATTNQAAQLVVGQLIQPLNSGTITFTRTAPAPVGTGTGTRTNLLTITFSDGALIGPNGGNAGTVLASTPDSAITFTSDFLDFSATVARNFSIALSAAVPSFGRVPGDTLNSFTADSAGTFGSDPAPPTTGGGNPPIPEPSVSILLGTGLAGLMVLAKRRKR